MAQLNRLIGESESDGLIYDGTHAIDAGAVAFVNAEHEAGELERGQVLFIATSSYSTSHALVAAGSYVKDSTKGDPGAIVAENTSYAEDDGSVTVPVYTSGAFRLSKIKTALDNVKIEKLREKNIIVK